MSSLGLGILPACVALRVTSRRTVARFGRRKCRKEEGAKSKRGLILCSLEVVGAFFDRLVLERLEGGAAGFGGHTLRSYEDDMDVFCRYLDESLGAGADPTVVDPARLRRYSAWLSSQGYAAATIARRLASLRSFFRHLRRQGMMVNDPSSGIRNPKQAKRLPRLLKIDDVIRLLDAVARRYGPGNA